MGFNVLCGKISLSAGTLAHVRHLMNYESLNDINKECFYLKN